MKGLVKHSFMLLPILLLSAITIFLCYKLYHRDERNKQSIMTIHESMTLNKGCSLDSTQYDVLCIGNSITKHAPYAGINWYSNHGMTASKPENDYCHKLEEKLKKLNKNSTVQGINISHWECDFSVNKDSLLQEYCQGKEIIVIRLGENVTDTENFKNALSDLILYCKQYTDRIILTGQYWTNEKKEAAIVSNARLHNIKYVPIDWIYELYRTECSPKEGDSITDTKGDFYKIEGDFLLTHPKDCGMEMIANTIYNSL